MTPKRPPQHLVAENFSVFHVEHAEIDPELPAETEIFSAETDKNRQKAAKNAAKKASGPSRVGKGCRVHGNTPKKSSQTRQNFPPSDPDPENFSASDEPAGSRMEPQDVDPAALYQAARARRMHYEAEASRMRAEVMSGRLVPRALLDELVGELGRRLDALTHRLDSAYGQGPAACVPECLAGIDEWLAARIDEYALRMAITPTNRV